MDRLFHVTLSGYILADSTTEARYVADHRLVQVDGMDAVIIEIQSVDDSWMDNLPYTINDDDQRTCRRILDDIAADELSGQLDMSYGPGPFP